MIKNEMTQADKSNRFRGCLLGLAVGDAIGTAVEFRSRGSFPLVTEMTGGGPFRSTDLMVYKIYTDGFQGLDYSGAAAQSIILMLLVMALTFVQFRYIEKRVHYT